MSETLPRLTVQMSDLLEVDVAVIGSGTAGLAAYRAARAAGARTVIIEGGPYGTRVNVSPQIPGNRSVTDSATYRTAVGANLFARADSFNAAAE